MPWEYYVKNLSSSEIKSAELNEFGKQGWERICRTSVFVFKRRVELEKPADPSTPNKKRLLYKVREVSQALNMCRASVYKLTAAGRLDSTKIGRNRRVTAAALEWFIEDSATGYR